jgi:nucleotide-binding universal stress UspA family protein
MPISLSRKLQALHAVEFDDLEFQVHRVGLTPAQVREYGLPSTPLKDTERRADKWMQATGVEQTEIDAIAALQPDVLRQLTINAISPFFDDTLDRRVTAARQQWVAIAQQAVDEQAGRRPYTGWEMSAYQTIVVGTDGSHTSMRAVERAAAIAADHGAKLIVATAHYPVREEKGRYAIPPGSDHGADYRMQRETPFRSILREASERAYEAGANNVVKKSIVGDPVYALVHLSEEVHADLLVVGNVGLNKVAGRLLGAVPSEVSRRAKTDVLIVHTTD